MHHFPTYHFIYFHAAHWSSLRTQRGPDYPVADHDSESRAGPNGCGMHAHGAAIAGAPSSPSREAWRSCLRWRAVGKKEKKTIWILWLGVYLRVVDLSKVLQKQSQLLCRTRRSARLTVSTHLYASMREGGTLRGAWGGGGARIVEISSQVLHKSPCGDEIGPVMVSYPGAKTTRVKKRRKDHTCTQTGMQTVWLPRCASGSSHQSTLCVRTD